MTIPESVTMSSFTAAMRVSPRVGGQWDRARATQSRTCGSFWDMEPALLLDKLGQHSTARFRMDKSDAPTVRPGTRLGIDQANAGRLQTFQGRFDVRHGVRDMVHPGIAEAESSCVRTSH